MKHFITHLIRFLLIATSPLLILILLYFYYDPFKVTKYYKDYSYSFVVPNRDYISTTMFINNYDKYQYNSFVFGSSRTLAFKPASWQKYLTKNDHPFMFDASGETIYGIYKKLKFLELSNIHVKNALIIICRDMSFKSADNYTDHLTIKHPIISGEGQFNFHMAFLKAYLTPRFLLDFFCFKIIGSYKPFMSGFIEGRKITMDTITNEINIIDQETEISLNTILYYTKRQELFYTRKGEKIDSTPNINKKFLFMLKEIKRILEKNNTNYKVILSPLYEQIKFNEDDLLILKKEFGNNLFDFSGKNSFTENKINYYEPSHFRPIIGDSILVKVYNEH